MSKHVEWKYLSFIKKKLFWKLLAFTIALGIIEDLIAVVLVTGGTITWQVLFIVTLIAVPFAIVGELFIDSIHIPQLNKKTEVFLEFLIFGICFGMAEDVLAIAHSTGEPITWEIIGIVFLIAVPFSAIGELIVDTTSHASLHKKRKLHPAFSFKFT